MARARIARPYIKRYALPFLAAVVCLSVEAVCDLLQPTIMARIIDTGVAAHDLGIVARLGLSMLGVAGIGAVGAIGRNIIAGLVSFRFAARLRADLFRRITSFSFDELDRFDTASLITRQTNDVTQVQAFVNGLMRILAKAPIVAVGSLVMAVILEPQLSLVLAVVVPVAAALITVNLLTGFQRFRRVQEGLDGVNSVTREYLGGIRVVKAFGREEHEVKRFAGANRELTSASTRALRVLALFGPAISLTVNLGIVAVLWVGGIRVGGASVQVGKTIAFINYMSQILFALGMISGVFMSFVRAKASWDRIGEVLGTPASEPYEERALSAAGQQQLLPPVSARPAPRSRATVEFAGVSFAYPGSAGRLVLEGVNLVCEPGRITAIIGPTGSGKSTLAALVPRFHDATSGVVLVGGVDVRSIDLAGLRGRIALVPQKTVLFTGTIAENLRWGREDAGQTDLEEAARAAAADDFIAGFPEGYGSVLGQGGVNLSGGQKQRVAIARALVRKPEVLVLDDCTSSVDSITEAEILAAIRGSAAGFTCILITQRISAAVAADRVLVLDDGRAAGVGTHAQLIRSCDVYRDICAAQLGREALNGPRGPA
ncbi:MAG: ABC transporter ATP-binding protein [Spirochaetes bacterium]|nr:ABC transporter ATP-binding protein [Spirochaetota bacterium]